MSRRSVTARGVSRMTSLTWATRQSLGVVTRSAPARPVALLGPRVAVVVVPVLLPEPGFVGLRHRDPADPLGALPEVQMRHEQSRRPTVFARERLAVVGVHDPRLPAGHVAERQVGRVAAVAPGADEGAR